MKSQGFITITFVIIIAFGLLFVCMQADNASNLLQALTNVQTYYTHDFGQQSCIHIQELQTMTRDLSFTTCENN